MAVPDGVVVGDRLTFNAGPGKYSVVGVVGVVAVVAEQTGASHTLECEELRGRLPLHARAAGRLRSMGLLFTV